MSSSRLRALLLVALWSAIAHARHLPSSEVAQHAVTSLSTGRVVQGAYSRNNGGVLSRRSLLSLDEDPAVAVRSPSSVVQDWSLVCQQLCGAALGGTACAAYCDTSDMPSLAQTTNADALLNSNKDVICQDLCRLQLGDAACNCAIANNIQNSKASDGASTDLTVSERNEVCSSFCGRSTATLAGCSLCNDGRTSVVATTTSEYTPQAADRVASDDDAVRWIPLDLAGLRTTTPDWNKLCASLCKTGDGGALCNCDLSPFFKSGQSNE